MPKWIDKVDKLNGAAEVNRIVIIDAEANSVPFLKGLESGDRPRAWLTRLKPNLLQGKEITGWTEWRPYRDGDMVRQGLVELNDPDGPGLRFPCKVVEIRRRTKGTSTYIGASTLLKDSEWQPGQLADLYFERWPCQERQFRTANQAVETRQVHGYGKTSVANIAVVNELDELGPKIAKYEESLVCCQDALGKQQSELDQQRNELGRARCRMREVAGRLQACLGSGEQVTPEVCALASEQVQLVDRERELALRVGRTEDSVSNLETKQKRIQQLLHKHRQRRDILEPRRNIWQHDVALDSLFAVFKCGLVLIVQYVLREYFQNTRMDVITFLERVATLHAWLRVLPDVEILTFEYNQRDPDVMRLLERHCDWINARRLRMRSGRILQMRVDPPPPARLPPPAWGTSADRFGSR